jgi:hypothetical protein
MVLMLKYGVLSKMISYLVSIVVCVYISPPFKCFLFLYEGLACLILANS